MRPEAGLLKVSQTDADLVHQALRGDQQACAELMARHRPRLERYAYFLLGNREEAEEALQDTFVRAFRGLDQCLDRSRVGTWMFQILVNRCRSRMRRLDLIDRGAGAEAAYATARAPTTWVAGEWREEIERALGELTSDQREAFLLRFVEDFSYDEMEALTGAPASALRMRVLRARQHLRRRLEEALRDHA